MSEVWNQKQNEKSLSWMSLTNIFPLLSFGMQLENLNRGLQRNPQSMYSLFHTVELIICIKTLTELLMRMNESVLTCAFCHDFHEAATGLASHITQPTTKRPLGPDWKWTPFNAAFPPDVETVDVYRLQTSLPPSAPRTNMGQICANCWTLKKMCRIRRKTHENDFFFLINFLTVIIYCE